MIGNRYLQELFNYEDESTSINQLLEYLKGKDQQFLVSLKSCPIDIENLNQEELKFMTIASALIDYYLQLHGLDVPDWLRAEKLQFEKPYFVAKRISDIDKVKLQYSNPATFKARNVYFFMEGLERV